MLESINDLPAHIFFVHAPVVLVPLIAFFCVVVAVRPRWRVTYAPLMAFATLVAFVCTFLAKESGEAFDELLAGQVDATGHEDLADQTTAIVFLLLLLTIAAAVLSRLKPKSKAKPVVEPSDGPLSADIAGVAGASGSVDTAVSPVKLSAAEPAVPTMALNALTVAIVAVSALATLWMIRTGDAGAKLVWDGTIGS